MTAAAAADDGDFASVGGRNPFDEVGVKMNLDDVRVTERHAAQALRDGTARDVHEMVHRSLWKDAGLPAVIVA